MSDRTSPYDDGKNATVKKNFFNKKIFRISNFFIIIGIKFLLI